MRGPSECKTRMVERIDGKGFRIELLVSEDRLEALLRITRGTADVPCPVARIADLARTAKLQLTSEESGQLPVLAARLLRQRSGSSACIARGVAPPAWPDIQWLIPIGLAHLIDDTQASRIDPHEVGHFVNVRQGQPLCDLPLQPGPGRDVFGQPLAPPASPIRLEKRVEMDPQTAGRVLASVEGCARFAGGALSVEQTLELRGDLDFRTGNIDFNGLVAIHGSVPDGYRVKGREVVIDGSVGGSFIESKGDLTILGGVNGLHKGRLTCGGKLKAHYLHQAVVECAGDALIDVECLESQLHAGGTVTVRKGGIIGGHVRAGGAVSAGALGSEMCVRTSVVAGYDDELVANAERAREMLRVSGAQVKDLAAAMGVYADRPAALFAVAAPERARLLPLQQKLDAAHEEHARNEALLLGFATAGAAQAASISVSRRLHGNVHLGVGACVHESRSELDGPLLLNADPVKATLQWLDPRRAAAPAPHEDAA